MRKVVAKFQEFVRAFPVNAGVFVGLFVVGAILSILIFIPPSSTSLPDGVRPTVTSISDTVFAHTINRRKLEIQATSVQYEATQASALATVAAKDS